jgi:hypothetical protein
MRKDRLAAADKRSTRTPAVLTSPKLGRSIPEIRFRSVVFPEPLGPIAAARVPASTVR